jgi:tetrahydromethanopterin:alpha-L-glutamate ligase
MTPAPEVLVLGAGGWHWQHLRKALEDRGIGGARLDLRQCALAVGGSRHGLELGPFEGLPAFVLVRAIPPGSFEQVTLRLGFLHALGELGVEVVNEARAIERCVDKAATSFHLAKAGIPTPPTWATESRERAQAILARETGEGHRLVLKPLFGAQGKGLQLLSRVEDLPPAEEVSGVFYLQRYVGGAASFEDYRVLVIGREPVAAMARRSSSWITNIRQGGAPHALPAEGELAELAVTAASAVGAEHAGVDLIRDPEGCLLVLEVNSMPAWQGLQSVSETDIAGCLADHLARRLRPPLRAVP